MLPRLLSVLFRAFGDSRSRYRAGRVSTVEDLRILDPELREDIREVPIAQRQRLSTRRPLLVHMLI
jgi:hypothetical protein